MTRKYLYKGILTPEKTARWPLFGINDSVWDYISPACVHINAKSNIISVKFCFTWYYIKLSLVKMFLDYDISWKSIITIIASKTKTERRIHRNIYITSDLELVSLNLSVGWLLLDHPSSSVKKHYRKNYCIYTQSARVWQTTDAFKNIAGREVVHCVSLLGGQMNLFVKKRKKSVGRCVCWRWSFAINIGNCHDIIDWLLCSAVKIFHTSWQVSIG